MSRLLRSGAVISTMTMISRVLGLVRDAIFANYFVIGGALDAFLVAFRIPNLLRRLFAEGAFSLAVVPVLSEYKETRSREALKQLIDYVAGTLGLILLVISTIGVLLAPLLILIFAPGFETTQDAEPELAAKLLRITFPYILFISLTAFISGILNTFRQFAVPAFTPVLLNIVMIVCAIGWAPHFEQPVEALAWGVLLGGMAQLAFQLPAVAKLGLLPRPRFKRGHEGVKKITRLMLPALFGSSVAQLNLLINTAIASFLGTSFISWLYFSDRFVELPLALIGVAIGTVILPKLSGDFANKASSAFSATLDWAMRLALLVALPAMIGLILLAEPILGTIIDNGVNDWQDVEMSAMSLSTYALGLPAFILVKVLAPGFYARQNTKTPVKIGITAMFANMLLNVLIVWPWYHFGYVGPHAGLALATALSGYLNAGLLFYHLRKENIYQPDQQTKLLVWFMYLFKLVVALGLMVALILWVNPVNSWWQQAVLLDKILHLLAIIALAVMVYFGSLYALGFRTKGLISPNV